MKKENKAEAPKSSIVRLEIYKYKIDPKTGKPIKEKKVK